LRACSDHHQEVKALSNYDVKGTRMNLEYIRNL